MSETANTTASSELTPGNAGYEVLHSTVIRGPFKTIRRDIRMILARDPAAKGALEVVLCYSGQNADGSWLGGDFSI